MIRLGKEDFGDRLRFARNARALNQTELAARAGLQPSAIGHFERGGRKPSFENIAALAKALSVTSDYLLGLTDAPTVSSSVFRDEERLSARDIDFIQMNIDTLNQRAPE
ncbi:helix-turn-helix transcriptional regulator [Marinobacter sp.]|uniref:helix-turn-helix domain-containing protein n=1 Tax=Marinobacter sp. TaxID=50741 RepID=UPI000C927080|nr:helix-turn-helix transcriptional regulator [Marinobacter sp.]MAB53452.1 XRE family transcriptional regulator [Marinobacter sp.]|tara:strand:- start:1090 stop:1416 length:327 start_codon:yes stop_codon:yes gene_type:complete